MSAEDRHAFDRDHFLSSHRALAACTRELGRLTDEVSKAATALCREVGDDAPEVRQTPGRCIVQLGPVALTISWLRSTVDTVADGRLLVVAWKGTVASGASRLPERSGNVAAARTAEALWEEVLVVDATSEGDWHWHPENDASQRFDSAALAVRCLLPLRAVLQPQG
jgi:hypothetical protein